MRICSVEGCEKKHCYIDNCNRKYYGKGYCQKKLGLDYNLSASSISNIINNKVWNN